MKKKGFTLIELMIVFSIIGVLATIGIISYASFLKQSRVVKRKTDLQELRVALEVYRGDHNGTYPATVGLGCAGDWCGLCSAFDAGGTITDTGVNGYIPNLAPVYVPRLPHNPGEKNNNTVLNASCTADQTCYKYKSDGINYKIVSVCGAELPVPYPTGDVFYDPTLNVNLQISTKGATGW